MSRDERLCPETFSTAVSKVFAGGEEKVDRGLCKKINSGLEIFLPKAKSRVSPLPPKALSKMHFYEG